MRYVTRRITSYKVIVVCIDTSNNKIVEHQEVTTVAVKNEAKFIKSLNDKFVESGEALKASYIKEIIEDSALYGVSYEDFMRLAVKMDNFRTPTKTNTPKSKSKKSKSKK